MTGLDEFGLGRYGIHQEELQVASAVLEWSASLVRGVLDKFFQVGYDDTGAAGQGYEECGVLVGRGGAVVMGSEAGAGVIDCDASAHDLSDVGRGVSELGGQEVVKIKMKGGPPWFSCPCGGMADALSEAGRGLFSDRVRE